eukprot:TRINITY_DN14767_c0_g1_i1.p1 TRINITY_DN14767_c0_g1~~TRINITY_DN14767_c0_g1_i1.p1  ORF type:complete len:1169 (+),score=129.54 TRINITY_DN14767_c0_g1_i1:54-3509(+)
MPPSGSERAPLVGQTRTLRDYEDDCLSEFSAYQSTRPSVANLRPGDRVEYKEYAVNFLFFKRFARLLYIGWDRLCTIIVCAMMAIALVGAYCQNDFLVALGGEVSTVTITALQTVAAMNEAGQCTVYKDVLRFDTCAEIFDVAKNNLWTGGSKECFGGFPDVCDNEVSRNTCFPPMQDGVVVPCLGPCDTAPTACWPTTVSRISDDLTTGQPSSRLPVGVWFLLWTILVPLGMSVAAMLGDVLIARLRRNVSVHMHKLVLEERRLYQLVTQETDIDNHDQRLTEDMEYCLLNGFGVCFGTRNQSSHLFYFLMLSVFGMRAAIRGVNNTGTAVVTWSFIAACAAVFILSYFVYIGTMNLISRILFNQKGYEGDFRWLHARIVEQCESICLYRGERKEHGVAAQKLRAVSKNFIRLSMFHSCLMGCTLFFDGLYAPLSFMFCFFAKVGTQDVLPFQSYVKNGIVYMTDLTRVFSGISVAAGACHRLATLIERLEEEPADLSPQRSTTVTADVRSSRPGSWRSLDMYSEAVDEIELPDVGSIGPQAETTDAPEIRFDAVTVYPPMSARPVFTDLSFSVTEGGSVCVVGPSGCGKSAVVRTLAGLWRQRYGTVTCPRQRGQHGVFFVPQRAYLTDGTLREQLTYPDSSDASDEAETQVLTDIIKDLELGRVLQMFGLDSPVAWSEVLSGGEAQRVCIARMLWHRPRFAVMDDSTSALDPELEVRVLLRLRRRRIGVLMTSGREPKSGTCERIIRLGSGQWSAEDTSEAAEVTVPESSPVVRDTAETIKSTAGSSRVDDKAKVVLFDALKDLAFFWKLTFPTLVCSNSLWLYLALTLHAVSAGLVISASRLSGEIINDLLAYNGGVSGGSVGSNFWLYLTLLWLNCLFVLVVSSAWCFCGMRLSLAMRVAVTEEMHRRYFRAGVPYAANVANPVADTIDQRMVQDQALAVEYLESFVFGGPGAGGALNVGTVGGTLQIVILTAYGMSLSWFTSLTVLLYLLLFIPIHLLCAIPIGKASVKLAQAEGRFRFSHARLREFVESVCMLAGEGMEAARLNRLMSDVVFWRKVRVGVYGILPVAAGWAQAFLNSGRCTDRKFVCGGHNFLHGLCHDADRVHGQHRRHWFPFGSAATDGPPTDSFGREHRLRQRLCRCGPAF